VYIHAHEVLCHSVCLCEIISNGWRDLRISRTSRHRKGLINNRLIGLKHDPSKIWIKSLPWQCHSLLSDEHMILDIQHQLRQTRDEYALRGLGLYYLSCVLLVSDQAHCFSPLTPELPQHEVARPGAPRHIILPFFRNLKADISPLRE